MKITLEVKIPQELLEADPNFADRVQEQLKYTGTQMVLEKIAWFKNRNFKK